MKDPLCLVPEEDDDDQPFYRDSTFDLPEVRQLIDESDKVVHTHLLSAAEINQLLLDQPMLPIGLLHSLS